MAEVSATIGKVLEIEVREIRENGTVVLFCNRWEPQEQEASVGDHVVVVSPRFSGVRKAELV